VAAAAAPDFRNFLRDLVSSVMLVSLIYWCGFQDVIL